MTEPLTTAIEPPKLEADIVCAGFGPATAGFLNTLTREFAKSDPSGQALSWESGVAPGLPPQVLCYERADDLGFGVSGVVTRARALRASLPEVDWSGIPMATPVTGEQMVYLLDPHGASRRSRTLRCADRLIRALRWALPFENQALKLPWTPAFLHKSDGLVLSIGQFLQWMGTQIQSTGAVQIWPATPVQSLVFDQDKVVGVKLLDQGVDKKGNPAEGFAPGMEIRAALTVIGDGPVGALGKQLDERLGMPQGHHASDWAVGMKFTVELAADTPLKPGTVLHTFGYPEPEHFGFLYVHPDRVASLGIFVPSWFDSPARTAYRYLQHWILHPYLWRYLKGATLRSWGAKTLAESGRCGEPRLVGDGFARIGEGSGSTNVLTGSGVDEAWATGTQLAEAVLELLRSKRPFTQGNLEETYVRRRRASWVEKEGRVAEKARDGFQRGVVRGLVGMALAGLTGGALSLNGDGRPPWKRIPSLEQYYQGRISPAELEQVRKECSIKGVPLHETLMSRCGWPAIPYDGQLLVSHQDALLKGGKVQAAPGYADHVAFLYPELCETCGTKICIELCSGQAIRAGSNGGVPAFDREKCIHCGVCHWNCAKPLPGNAHRTNIDFRAGTGGLHSAEN